MSKKPFNRKCDSENCNHISYSKSTYYTHRDTCKLRMADHTLQPGYKLLKDMVNSKKTAQVKSYWTTANDENQTNVRLCLAKLKEEKLKLERKLREIEKFHDRALVVEGIINSYDAQRTNSNDDSQTDELAPTKKAKTNEVTPAIGVSGSSILGGFLGYGTSSSSSSSSTNTK